MGCKLAISFQKLSFTDLFMSSEDGETVCIGGRATHLDHSRSGQIVVVMYGKLQPVAKLAVLSRLAEESASRLESSSRDRCRIVTMTKLRLKVVIESGP
jgi:hypothetical protein